MVPFMWNQKQGTYSLKLQDRTSIHGPPIWRWIDILDWEEPILKRHNAIEHNPAIRKEEEHQIK